jgi:23S rRNA (cytosine1962-C5)-methyltransferase
LGKNQNIGFFLDMKLGRDLVKKYCEGQKILNLFSYTCMFSLVAMKNGAQEVINLDMSKAVLNKGRENHKLNQLNLKNVQFLSHDIFKTFGLLRRHSPYDFIIIDPPSDHGAHFLVERDYPKLISRIAEWSKPGAYIMTCLNSPFHSFSFLEECVQKNAPDLVLMEKCGAPQAFEEIDPDRGLKIILWKRS